MKLLKKILHLMTLDYEVAVITCIENKLPLTKENINKIMESLEKR